MIVTITISIIWFCFSFLLLPPAVAQDVDNANKKLTHDKVISGIFDYDLASRIVDETNLRREAEGRAPANPIQSQK